MTQPETQKCIQAISQTGFVLESSVASLLQEKQWSILTNRYYLDDVTSIPREIDLIAYKAKTIEKVTIYTALIISCKKSDQNAWIFLTRNLDKHDRNIELYPVDIWSNSKVMNHQNVRKHLKAEVGLAIDSHPNIKELFDIERNVFAFQEVNLNNGTPQNDKRIYDSISSCIKAMEYERAALKNRRSAASVYQFVMVNIVESRLIEYSCQDRPPVVKEVEHIRYLNRFIVNKIDDFHIFHFIAAGRLEHFLSTMDEYHMWTISQCQHLYDVYKSKLVSDHSLRNLFADELTRDFLFSVYMKVKYDLKQEYTQPEKVTVWADEDRKGLVIDVGITDENILQALNSDRSLTTIVAKSLRERASYEGTFRFGAAVFEDDIPF